MLYEEFQRVGHSVFEAFDQVRSFAANGSASVAAGNGAASPSAASEPTPDNEKSMAAFMGMIGRVGGMPG